MVMSDSELAGRAGRAEALVDGEARCAAWGTIVLMAVTKADLHRKVEELPESALELADQLLESAAHDPIQEEGERFLRENPGLRARLDEVDRKLKAGEPLKTVEHEELRRRLKAMGVPLED
jgi:hypothetical protein